MSRPDIRIATIIRTVQGKAYLFTAIYFRTSLIKGCQIYKSINIIKSINGGACIEIKLSLTFFLNFSSTYNFMVYQIPMGYRNGNSYNPNEVSK